MILLDFSGIQLSCLYSLLKNMDGVWDAKEYKNFVLRTILSHKIKFGGEYGKYVFCHDANQNTYWRKDIFKNYKSERAKAKKKQQLLYDNVDWDDVHEVMREVKTDFDTVFPYKIMNVNRMEADDIIATLTKNFHHREKIVIISRDHDFKQLLQYPNVKLYDPFKKAFVAVADPKKYILEHTIRGDTGDCIPNILSDENTFVTAGKRQNSIRKVNLDKWLEMDYKEFCENKTMLKRYIKNKSLVDLSELPAEYEKNILEEFEKPANGDNKLIYRYLVTNQLAKLAREINLFTEN